MKSMKHIDFLFTAVGEADDGYVAEMLDDGIAKEIKKSNLRKRYVFAACAACAAVLAVSLTVNLLPFDGGQGIIKTSGKQSSQGYDEKADMQSVCADADEGADMTAGDNVDPDNEENVNKGTQSTRENKSSEGYADNSAADKKESNNNGSSSPNRSSDGLTSLTTTTSGAKSIDQANPDSGQRAQQLKEALLEIINNNNVPYTAGEFVSALTLDSTLKIAGVTIYKDGSAEDIEYDDAMNDDVSSGAVSAIFDGASDGALTEYDGAAAEADRTEVKAQIRTDDESVSQDVQITVTSDGYINIDMDGSQFTYQADQSAAERVEEYFRQLSVDSKE